MSAPIDATMLAAAKAARALLRTGILKESQSRDREEVTLVVDPARLIVLRNAVTAWDDAAHEFATGGGA